MQTIVEKQKQYLEEINNIPQDLSVGWGQVSPEQIEAMTEILNITKARRILEIGFNRGASALGWLLNDIDFLYSIDIEGSLNAVHYVTNKFGKDRFQFKRIDSRILKYEDLNMNFDLVFIDGDHSFQGALNDIQKSLLFNPKFILFDDYCHPHHGVDIKNAVNLFNNYFNKLKFVKEFLDKRENSTDPGFGLYFIN